MSVYSQYAIGASSDVAVDESYDGLVGIYRMIEESALNEHAIFEHIIACDFAEAYTNNGTMTESSLEAINEASLSEIWGKVKEFLKKMWEKILGIIKNLITKIESVFIRDGKQLVKKYDKEILKRMNGGKLSKMPVKYKAFVTGRDKLSPTEPEWFKNDVIAVIDGNESELGKAYAAEATAAKENDHWASGGQDNIQNNQSNGKKWSEIPDTDKDHENNKPYTSDKLEDLKDSALSAFMKKMGDSSSTDSKSFATDLMEFCLDDRDEEGFTSTDYGYCKGILEKSTKMTTYLKKQESLARKQYKNDIKEIEEIQKRWNKDLTNKDHSANAGWARVKASRAIQLNSARSAVVGTIFAGLTAVYKKAASEARSMWVKAASYGGKSESAFLEAVEEVSDWEVEEMFVM